MSLPYHSGRVEEAGQRFDETVRRFEVTTPPEAAICMSTIIGKRRWKKLASVSTRPCAGSRSQLLCMRQL